jgi:hypothetical protein
LLIDNISGNKTQQQEKLLEQAYCHPVTRLAENCPAFRTKFYIAHIDYEVEAASSSNVKF